MKKITAALSAIFLLTSVLVFAQGHKVEGNGNISKQKRSVDNFSGISVSGSMVVKVSPGISAVEVEADGNLQGFIVTEVKNGNLHVSTKNGYSIKSAKGIVVYVSMPRIEQARISGSGSLKGSELIPAGDKFDVSVSGSGNCELAVSAEKANASISGSGSIVLSGSSKELDVKISGSGTYKGYEMTTHDANVIISGSGDAQTNINGKLDAVISGSGSVLYKGSGDVSVKTSGSGHLRKVD